MLCILLALGFGECALQAHTMTLELFACSIEVPDTNWTAEEHLNIDTAKRSILILDMQRARPAARVSIGMGFANLTSDVGPEVIGEYVRMLRRRSEVVSEYGRSDLVDRPAFYTVSTRADTEAADGIDHVYRTLIPVEGYCYMVTVIIGGDSHPERDAGIRRVIRTLRIGDERTPTIDRLRESMGIARYDNAYTLYKAIKLSAEIFVAAGLPMTVIWMYRRRRRHAEMVNRQLHEEPPPMP
ncbi:MAG TPA: hypothetical protein VHI13_16965 [Candidatus Kapabacteria bacterium]|nr:hypothetical protein [Candidatus Kapabacteria bacterium]